jgi:formate/nitrite transporter FocA (FNT family)
MSGGEADGARPKLSARERRRIEEMTGLKAPVIYESIRQEGEHELSRPFSALWWSGVAAGLGISASVLCKAALTAALPHDAPWAPAVSNLGYAVGFLIMILGRLQLFTENTITPILTFLLAPSARNFGRIARLWSIVFAANMAGCLFAAAMIVLGGVLPPAQTDAVVEISRHYAHATAWQHLAWGAPAGFLIAALVWALPSCEGGGEFFMILVVTYMIGLAGLSHVVAGSTELFVLALRGELGWVEALRDGVAPAFAGNVLGGTGLFAMLAYGQVRQELAERTDGGR